MKAVLFDVDGVFLSEERCFDVSALTVYEILMSQQFLKLMPTVEFNKIADGDITLIRQVVFDQDKILNAMKSRGLNSNWDMLFIALSIHLIDLLKNVSPEEKEAFLTAHPFTDVTIQDLGECLNDHNLDFVKPLDFLENAEAGKSQIYRDLRKYAEQELNTTHTELFEIRSPLWEIAQEVYQEWYLGHRLYRKVEDKTPRSDFKTGYIYQEAELAPIDQIQELLSDLKKAGYQLAIATGRPRTETLVPFEDKGLASYFDSHHIATASEVLLAEEKFPELKPLGKPNPFSYITAYNGNNEANYREYAENQKNVFSKKEIFIVGDSLADLFSADTTDATFIGTLTGLKGKAAESELTAHQADYIVDNVLDIRKILL
ncbi:HAD family hydrolase [Staphylococcus condimenti]|uniref:HAD family hydrolase n=1 Tax=Staphylococcus condimenti TaxID=70255 RepID=A0A4Q7CS83_9STAP|nr:HAD hydrolase-like protein [Staphylococcus condimenti]RZI03447.1 HAD family hydrolase [Staphylococcus condimenti]RZI04878.1 HAD family hydrolase [Staphylococcus condimenti]